MAAYFLRVDEWTFLNLETLMVVVPKPGENAVECVSNTGYKITLAGPAKDALLSFMAQQGFLNRG